MMKKSYLLMPPSFFPRILVRTFSQMLSAISVATFFSTSYVSPLEDRLTFFFNESITGVSSSFVIGVSPTKRFINPVSLPNPQLEEEEEEEEEDSSSSGRSISDSFCQ